jgi:uncharacterized protein
VAMSEPGALEKTTRINSLYDFYEPLLTDKQRTFLQYYHHDDYSLGEIAAEFDISRQAVYEHIKRAEQVLEAYEAKLQLLSRHEEQRSLLDLLDEAVAELEADAAAARLREAAGRLRQSIERE